MAKKIEGKKDLDAMAREVNRILGHSNTDPSDEAFRDGYYAASVTVEEVLQAVRVDIENAGLSGAAETAAKLAVEMVSRLWYERKEGK